MIELIGAHDSLTATLISSLKGITKGTVSQTTSRLQKKGLIKKELSPNGNNEVLISLTPAGKIIYQNHLKFHQDLTAQIMLLANELPQESLNIVMEMLNTVDQALDQY